VTRLARIALSVSVLVSALTGAVYLHDYRVERGVKGHPGSLGVLVGKIQVRPAWADPVAAAVLCAGVLLTVAVFSFGRRGRIR
jgi:hypothetical protein